MKFLYQNISIFCTFCVKNGSFWIFEAQNFIFQAFQGSDLNFKSQNISIFYFLCKNGIFFILEAQNFMLQAFQWSEFYFILFFYFNLSLSSLKKCNHKSKKKITKCARFGPRGRRGPFKGPQYRNNPFQTHICI